MASLRVQTEGTDQIAKTRDDFTRELKMLIWPFDPGLGASRTCGTCTEDHARPRGAVTREGAIIVILESYRSCGRKTNAAINNGMVGCLSA